MANNDNLNKKELKDLAASLNQLGVGGYQQLVHQAILHDWTRNRFVQHLVHEPAFQRQFPGLVQGGEINAFLLGQENASVNVTNLGAAVTNYGKLWKSYEQAGSGYGFGKLSKVQVAALIKGEVSPQEFRKRSAAIDNVRKNPELFDFWKKEAKKFGAGDLNVFRAAAGLTDRKFNDIYEAARLRQEFGLSAKDAGSAAKSIDIGNPATSSSQSPQSLEDIVTAARQNLQDIQPELAAQGIGVGQLVKALANPSQYGREMQAIQQALATKRARGQYVAGSQARAGEAGGPSLYAPDSQAAYG
jgi:hypothetical protein